VAVLNWMKYNYNRSPKVMKGVIQELLMVKDMGLIEYMETVFQRLYPSEKNPYSIQYRYSMDTITDTVSYKQTTNNTNNTQQGSVLSGVPDFKKLIRLYQSNGLSFTEKQIESHIHQYGIDHVTGALLDFAEKVSDKIKNPNGYFKWVLENYTPPPPDPRKEIARETLRKMDGARKDVQEDKQDPQYQEEAKKFFAGGHTDPPKEG